MPCQVMGRLLPVASLFVEKRQHRRHCWEDKNEGYKTFAELVVTENRVRLAPQFDQ